MNPIPELTPLLKQLRLSGILDSIEARNRQAIEARLAYPEFLALLIQDEIARREQKKFSLRIRRAGFRSQKTVEQFDFDFNPGINRALIQELAAGRFIQEPANILIAGPCGTGKSHISPRHSATVPFARDTMSSSPPRPNCSVASRPLAPWAPMSADSRP